MKRNRKSRVKRLARKLSAEPVPLPLPLPSVSQDNIINGNPFLAEALIDPVNWTGSQSLAHSLFMFHAVHCALHVYDFHSAYRFSNSCLLAAIVTNVKKHLLESVSVVWWHQKTTTGHCCSMSSIFWHAIDKNRLKISEDERRRSYPFTQQQQ